MKKNLIEQLERQKELMSFMEQSTLSQTLGQGIVQAIKTGLAKNILQNTLGIDNVDMDREDSSTTSSDVTPLTKTTTDDEFYKSILKGIGAPITDENMKFFYAWRQAEGGKARNNPFNTTQSKPGSTFYNCLKKGV
jgi:hypothetical protein